MGQTNRDQRCGGFTLIELLLYMVLAGTLLGGVVFFLGTVLEVQVRQESVAEVDQQGEAAIENIANTARHASSIAAPASGNTAAAVSFSRPAAEMSPTVYDTAGGRLRIKEGTASAIPLTNDNVTAVLSVTNLTRPSTSGIVQVNLTLSRVNVSGRSEYDYQKTFTTSVALRGGP